MIESVGIVAVSALIGWISWLRMSVSKERIKDKANERAHHRELMQHEMRMTDQAHRHQLEITTAANPDRELVLAQAVAVKTQAEAEIARHNVKREEIARDRERRRDNYR